MLAIVRVKMNDGSDKLWDYILKNREGLEKKFNDCVQLMYMTKRARFEDTSLFLHAENLDCFGDFVAKVIAPIKDVNALWLFNLYKLRFFRFKEELLDDWKRLVITIKGYPAKFEEIYTYLTKLKETADVAPVYMAYTFHLYGDSIIFSLAAKDEAIGRKFIADNVKDLPGVLNTNVAVIKKHQRIASPQIWKLYVKSNLLPKA